MKVWYFRLLHLLRIIFSDYILQSYLCHQLRRHYCIPEICPAHMIAVRLEGQQLRGQTLPLDSSQTCPDVWRLSQIRIVGSSLRGHSSCSSHNCVQSMLSEVYIFAGSRNQFKKRLMLGSIFYLIGGTTAGDCVGYKGLMVGLC